jgi:hypothetical protein
MEEARSKFSDYDGREAAEPFRNLIVAAWAERFGLTEKMRSSLCDEDFQQLSLCRSDEARRLILGVSQ